MKILVSTLFFLAFNSYAGIDVPYVQVQGNCDIKVIPDRGTITFTSEHQMKDQKEAVKKTTAQIEKLKASIEELKLKDIEFKNTQYNVYPVREYEKDKMVDKGFMASLGLEITTSEISRIGEAMMKASSAGVVNVGTLVTFLSLEKSRSEYLKCLDLASDDAKAKAKQLGKKLDFEVGEVISLNEVPQTQQQPPQPMAMMKGAMMDDASAPKIEAGTQRYSTNIQVTFSIK